MLYLCIVYFIYLSVGHDLGFPLSDLFLYYIYILHILLIYLIYLYINIYLSVYDNL